jgi:hypothetical protein
MLRVLNDANADQARRDRMAESSAPFCHPRLGLVASTDASNSAGIIGTIHIISVPRGAQWVDGRIVYDNGVSTPPPAFTPLQPTPDVLELPAPSAVEPDPRPLPVQPEPEPDDGMVTPLAAWRRRSDGDEPGAQ